LGKEKGKVWAQEKEIPCAILEYSGTAWISPAMKKHTQPSPKLLLQKVLLLKVFLKVFRGAKMSFNF